MKKYKILFNKVHDVVYILVIPSEVGIYFVRFWIPAKNVRELLDFYRNDNTYNYNTLLQKGDFIERNIRGNCQSELVEDCCNLY